MQAILCRTALALLLSLALTARAQSVSLKAEPPNLGLLSSTLTPDYKQILIQDLEAYHDCTGAYGCYADDLTRETAVAMRDLEEAVRENRGGKLALVLDIDETALSNWQEMRPEHLGYTAAHWNAWVERAEAPAIPGTLALYRRARALHVAVFFVTGRGEAQRAATERNLRRAGYGGWTGLFLRPATDKAASVVPYKSAQRATIVREGYRMVLNVGDQFSDLEGEPAATRSVKLSDPFYFIP